MNDDPTFVWMLLFWSAIAYCVYVRMFVVRPLRKKVEGLVEARLATAAPVAEADQQSSPEVEQLKQRVQVLERIATDGNPMLRHEIEALRHL